ncbi:LexA family transcriptional regulator [Cytophaga sp. FL35]|uniref:XRE family transcriptional regulator n=1 Tax=Cytophaga sp. FL35 TaxID=1904456 RepID=UPI000C637A58|nr:LexA family transcriptional regulator [Cytophaga sp. FL35]MAU70544.1 XRE family transcriptional regulator [Pseudozobellia sp.]MBC7000785.1 LexA family transcriptional regulator [Cytophaga sp. FL35]MBG48032.1 XRE family transcriptional regulator [Pseudozobellia sp.]|tara:strand:+ start:1415 stop:2188 length:774 start_codon:yes stop_codon:yes gene_type:complete
MNFISKNIRHLRDLKGLSQEQLAEELGITRSNLGSKEEGRSQPNLDLLISISDYFRIPVDILIKKDLTKAKDFSFIELGNQRVLFPIMVDSENEDLIEVVPVKTSAGYLAGYDDPEYIEQLAKIKLPFLPTGKHRAFPIKGDSMLPMKDGAFVIGKFVENRSDIVDGKTYILLTRNNGMVYKRVYNRIHMNNTLQLVSDNSAYEPYEVAIDEVLELWEFTCSINTQEYSAEELKLSSIVQLFNSLGVELEALRRLIG